MQSKYKVKKNKKKKVLCCLHELVNASLPMMKKRGKDG